MQKFRTSMNCSSAPEAPKRCNKIKISASFLKVLFKRHKTIDFEFLRTGCFELMFVEVLLSRFAIAFKNDVPYARYEFFVGQSSYWLFSWSTVYVDDS